MSHYIQLHFQSLIVVIISNCELVYQKSEDLYCLGTVQIPVIFRSFEDLRNYLETPYDPEIVSFEIKLNFFYKPPRPYMVKQNDLVCFFQALKLMRNQETSFIFQQILDARVEDALANFTVHGGKWVI